MDENEDSPINSYERERLENIASNQRRMAAIGLPCLGMHPSIDAGVPLPSNEGGDSGEDYIPSQKDTQTPSTVGENQKRKVGFNGSEGMELSAQYDMHTHTHFGHYNIQFACRRGSTFK